MRSRLHLGRCGMVGRGRRAPPAPPTAPKRSAMAPIGGAPAKVEAKRAVMADGARHDCMHMMDSGDLI